MKETGVQRHDGWRQQSVARFRHFKEATSNEIPVPVMKARTNHRLLIGGPYVKVPQKFCREGVTGIVCITTCLELAYLADITRQTDKSSVQ